MPSKRNYQKSIHKFGRRKKLTKMSVFNKIMAFFTNSVTALKNVVEFSHMKKTPKVRVTMPVMAIVEKDGLKYQLVP